MSNPDEDHGGIVFVTNTGDISKPQKTENSPKNPPLNLAAMNKSRLESIVPIDSKKVESRKLIKAESCFFKSLATDFTRSSRMNPRKSVMRVKLTNLYGRDTDSPSFTKTIFNPKSKFMDSMENNFHTNASNHAKR